MYGEGLNIPFNDINVSSADYSKVYINEILIYTHFPHDEQDWWYDSTQIIPFK